MTPEERAEKVLKQIAGHIEAKFFRDGGFCGPEAAFDMVADTTEFTRKMFREAVEEEREAIAQFIETHTTEWSTGEVMPSITEKPSPSQTSLANSIRQRSSE